MDNTSYCCNLIALFMFLVLSTYNPIPPHMSAADSVADRERGNALVLLIASKMALRISYLTRK